MLFLTGNRMVALGINSHLAANGSKHLPVLEYALSFHTYFFFLYVAFNYAYKPQKMKVAVRVHTRIPGFLLN